MLSDEKIDALAQQLNDSVNLPILGEKAEFKVFKEFVRKANTALQGELSPEAYGFINSAEQGIAPEEKAAVKEQIFAALKAKVNLPIVKGKLEEALLSALSDKISNAMEKGQTV